MKRKIINIIEDKDGVSPLSGQEMARIVVNDDAITTKSNATSLLCPSASYGGSSGYEDLGVCAASARSPEDAAVIKYPIKNREILRWFKKSKVHSYLSRIMRGQVKSERHLMMMKPKGRVDCGLNSKLMRLARLDFLEIENGCQNIDLTLFELVMETIYKKYNYNLIQDVPLNRCWGSEANFAYNYVTFVLIPEGIIYCLRDKMKCSQAEAEKEFTKVRVTEEELAEFDDDMRQQESCSQSSGLKKLPQNWLGLDHSKDITNSVVTQGDNNVAVDHHHFEELPDIDEIALI